MSADSGCRSLSLGILKNTQLFLRKLTNADKRAKSVFSEPEPRERTGDVSPRASSAQPRAVGLRGRFLRGARKEPFPFRGVGAALERKVCRAGG